MCHVEAMPVPPLSTNYRGKKPYCTDRYIINCSTSLCQHCLDLFISLVSEYKPIQCKIATYGYD